MENTSIFTDEALDLADSDALSNAIAVEEDLEVTGPDIAGRMTPDQLSNSQLVQMMRMMGNGKGKKRGIGYTRSVPTRAERVQKRKAQRAARKRQR